MGGGRLLTRALREGGLRWTPASRLADLPAGLEGAEFRPLREAVDLPAPRVRFLPEGHAASERYAERIAKGGIGQVGRSERSGILSLRGADVLMPWGLHRWRGRVFRDGLLNPRLLENPKYAWLLESMPLRRRRAGGEAVLLTLPFYHNFYHWLLEILPRVALLETEPGSRDLPLLVPEGAPSYVAASLRLAAPDRRLEPLADGCWRFDLLHLPTRISPASRACPWAVDWLRERLLPPDASGKGRRLYITRRDARARFVANEDEVLSVLAEYGYETVCPGELPFEEQIRLFAEADHVVGAHGAAFSNLAFAPRGARFVEFFEDGHFNPAFLQLAALRGLEYGLLVGASAGSGQGIDADALRRLMGRVHAAD